MQRKLFKVRGSETQSGKSWKVNREYNVVCETALDAMEATKKEYPNLEIHSVQLSGSIDHIAAQDA
tara:strand:- start:131 stop:328 length:198 start_codon:yes stop_codon:yes gene_type:complete